MSELHIDESTAYLSLQPLDLVIRYLYDDESSDYLTNTDENHIFHAVVGLIKLRQQIAAVAASTDELPEIDAHRIDYILKDLSDMGISICE